MRIWSPVALLSLMVVSSGCSSNIAPRECVLSTQCTSSPAGECATAPSGQKWCLYPDPSCPGGSTGQRWSSVADPGLANQCVPGAQLAVSVAGDGGGTVSSMPQGIACGSTCAMDYSQGTHV